MLTYLLVGSEINLLYKHTSEHISAMGVMCVYVLTLNISANPLLAKPFPYLPPH